LFVPFDASARVRVDLIIASVILYVARSEPTTAGIDAIAVVLTTVGDAYVVRARSCFAVLRA